MCLTNESSTVQHTQKFMFYNWKIWDPIWKGEWAIRFCKLIDFLVKTFIKSVLVSNRILETSWFGNRRAHNWRWRWNYWWMLMFGSGSVGIRTSDSANFRPFFQKQLVMFFSHGYLWNMYQATWNHVQFPNTFKLHLGKMKFQY